MTDAPGPAPAPMPQATQPARPEIPPPIQLLEIASGFWRSRAIAVAAELEIADQLANGPLPVDELAARTKTHAPSLFRLLRALESIGVFQQVSPRVFANSQLSDFLRKGVPGSQWAAIRLSFSADMGQFEAFAGLLGSIQTGEIAFDKTYGHSFWEFLRRDPAKGAIFGEAMRSLTAAGTPMSGCGWRHRHAARGYLERACVVPGNSLRSSGCGGASDSARTRGAHRR